MTNNKKEGFTLIELMIVVAIIGILAAIAIPQFNSFKTKAQDGKALSDLGAIANAEEAKYLASSTYDVVNATKATSNTTIIGATSGSQLAGAKASKDTSYQVIPGSSGIASSFAAYTSNAKGSRTYGADNTGVKQYDTTIWVAGTSNPSATSMSAWGKTSM